MTNFPYQFPKPISKQVGEEVGGMVMVRSADKRQGVCPIKFLQEVWPPDDHPQPPTTTTISKSTTTPRTTTTKPKKPVSSLMASHRAMHMRSAATVPPKRSKTQLASDARKASNKPLNNTSTPSTTASKTLQLYSLTKLVADATNKSTATTRPALSQERLRQLSAVAALTKTTTSNKRSIPSAREEPKKKASPEDSQRNFHMAKKTNELRAHDYWDRFRESKLEKMRQHKLNVEQRMRENGGGVGDNYSYYWDNINHCYSDQTHSRGNRGHSQVHQKMNNRNGAADHSLPSTWYTDNIYSNWSIDLDEEEDQRRRRNNDSNNNNINVSGRRRTWNRNSCDINGNSPYKMTATGPHGFAGMEASEEEEEVDDIYNNNNNYLVDRYRAQLKPTTPTKYGNAGGGYGQSKRSGCAFGNGAGHDAMGDDFENQLFSDDKRNNRRGIPKSKSFGQESTRTRGRFGLGSSFLWQGRRSKTTNLLMDIQSRFRRGIKGPVVVAAPEVHEPKSRYTGVDGHSYPQVSPYYCDNGQETDFDGYSRDGPSLRGSRPRIQRNRSMDDEVCSRRKSRFNFHHNLLLNSEEDEEEDVGSDLGFHSREMDYNNNLQRGAVGDPSESYYRHQEAMSRPPIRPSSLNLNGVGGGRFNRGRSLDDYEYTNRSRNLNYIDKNLNIFNFLNSARNIPQEFHAEVVVDDHHVRQEDLTEQIFNPNVEYGHHSLPKSGSKINRMRNFSSLDLDWDPTTGEPAHQGILQRTSAIFGNIINSPQTSPSIDDILMNNDNDIIMCPVDNSYLNFRSDPEPMPKKSCMKKPQLMKHSASDFVLHHPHQALDYKLNTYYPQEEFNEPCVHPVSPGEVDTEDDHLGLGDSFHLDNNCCGSLNNNVNVNNLDITNGNLHHHHSLSDDEEDDLDLEEQSRRQSQLDPNTLHIINNIFSIYKPNQYSPLNCHNPTQDNVKVDNYCKKISLPSTMRPLGEPMAGQNKVDMDDDYLLSDQNNNNIVPHDAYDDCFVEGPSAILGNRRRKSTFFASLKRPLMVVKSKSCHDSVAASDDHWFCSGDLSGKWHDHNQMNANNDHSSSTNLLNALTSPTDSNNSLLEKRGLFKFSPTSTTETSYFYPFDYYFNSSSHNNNNSNNHPHHHTGTKKKSLIKLRSTTRPLSFSH